MSAKKKSKRGATKKWFNKWLPSIDIKINWKTDEPVPPKDYKFLTTKEVKAAQAAQAENERKKKENEIPLVEYIDQLERPPVPKVIKRHRSLTHRFKDLIFGIFPKRKKKHSRKTHHSHHQQSFTLITDDNVVLSDESSHEETAANQVTSSRPAIGSVHRHRRKKKRIWSLRSHSHKHHKPSPAPLNAKDSTAKKKIALKVYLEPFLHSTSLFIVAYLAAWLTYQFATIIAASINGLDTVLYYYEIMFPSLEKSMKWTETDMVFIALAGPAVSVVLGIVYYVLLRFRHPGQQIRTFLLWLYLHSIMIAIGTFLGGAYTPGGSGFVADWLSLHIAVLIPVTLLLFSLVSSLSWRMIRFIPEAVGSDSFKQNRTGFLLSRFMAPWLAGSTLLVLTKYKTLVPHDAHIFSYDAVYLGILLFAVVTPLFNMTTPPHRRNGRKPYRPVSVRSLISWGVVAMLLLLIVRFGLSNGLYLKVIADFGQVPS